MANSAMMDGNGRASTRSANLLEAEHQEDCFDHYGSEQTADVATGLGATRSDLTRCRLRLQVPELVRFHKSCSNNTNAARNSS